MSTGDVSSSGTTNRSLSLPDSLNVQGGLQDNSQNNSSLSSSLQPNRMSQCSLSTTGYCPMTLYSDRSHGNRTSLESLYSQGELTTKISVAQHSASAGHALSSQSTISSINTSTKSQSSPYDENMSPKESFYPENVPVFSAEAVLSSQMPGLAPGSAVFAVSEQQLSSLICRAVQQVLQDATQAGLNIGDLNGLLPGTTADFETPSRRPTTDSACRISHSNDNKEPADQKGSPSVSRSIEDQATSQPPLCYNVKPFNTCKERIVAKHDDASVQDPHTDERRLFQNTLLHTTFMDDPESHDSETSKSPDYENGCRARAVIDIEDSTDLESESTTDFRFENSPNAPIID